jgi:hypothetical protein
MDYQLFLKELCDLGPRFAENEIQAARLIEQKLRELQVSFIVQPFTTEEPVCTHAELTADGESIPCQGSSMVSGEIPDAKYVISHFGYSGESVPYNIAYNPLSDYICSADHYNVPSVSVARESLTKIFMAHTVKGRVAVEKRQVESENILVGNTQNPSRIIFAHYDSIIGRGAMDNAGSVVALVRFIDQNRHFLDTNLFIFAGNEELSYDSFGKSYYGFRVFEEKYLSLLQQTKQIIVIDGVGLGQPQLSQEWLDWVFYIKNFEKLKEKIFWLQNDQTDVFQLFHTQEDTEEHIQDNLIQDAEKLLAQIVSSD